MTATVTHKQLKMIRPGTVFYDHQIVGVRMMARINSFILGDDMGLGKTLAALTVAAVDYEMGYANRLLVVCPATLKWNWAEEIDKHTLFRSMVLEGSPKNREQQLAQFGFGGADILVVNYEQVGPHLEVLNGLGFEIVIMDEAHLIKNQTSARTKACHALKGDRFFMLTGSPILNTVVELWSLLHRIEPHQYPNFYRFQNRYAVFGGYKDKQIVGVKNEAELKERVARVMIRRRKSEVLDLPEKQIVQVVVDLHPEQRALYTQANEELRISTRTVVNGEEMELVLDNALTKFLRLKQICGTTATIDGHPDHSYKLDRVEEMVAEITESGERVVVFTQFRAVQACVVNRLTKLGITAYALNGDTPTKERVPCVNTWARHPQAAMVAMLQVAGVGLNMTAASKAIFVDKLFVPKLNEQAADRLHRIGADQTKPVQIFELICRNTIESRVEAILRRKARLFGALIDSSDWKREILRGLQEEED